MYGLNNLKRNSMENIHILPTEGESDLFYADKGKELCYTRRSTFYSTGQHIYITSDEEIKKDDWYYNERLNQIFQAIIDSGYNTTDKEFKIILTTDTKLIADGVQDIDDEFLEWFVRNSSCEFVEVKLINDSENHPELIGNPIEKWSYYEIIIPQEELKSFSDFSDKFFGSTEREGYKQEKLEEAAKKYAELSYYNGDEVNAFVNGSKWQAERMYSEEEVKEIIKLSCEEGMLIQRTINDKVKIPYMRIKDFTIRIFEQFKKK